MILLSNMLNDYLKDITGNLIFILLAFLFTILIQAVPILFKKFFKTSDDKIQLLEKIVLDAVLETNQTYVDALKEEGVFTLEAQKIAFDKTKDAVLTVISQKFIKSLINSGIVDFDSFLTTMIESCVNKCKKKSIDINKK